MRKLNAQELKKVSGGKSNENQENVYGGMPNPPNLKDFSSAVAQGAGVGLYLGGPVGAIEGGIVGGSSYIIYNATYNAYNYYF